MPPGRLLFFSAAARCDPIKSSSCCQETVFTQSRPLFGHQNDDSTRSHPHLGRREARAPRRFLFSAVETGFAPADKAFLAAEMTIASVQTSFR